MQARWVVAGGKIGELGHCTRCGQGLSLGGGPQPIPIVSAAMKAFVGMHKNCREGDLREPDIDAPSAWIQGRDTGVSSCTIYAVMINTPSQRRRYSVPWDPDDFGRCYRLLALFPDWRKRLSEVSQRFPEWTALVREWDELTALYEEELPQKSAPKLYARMKELIAESKSALAPPSPGAAE